MAVHRIQWWRCSSWNGLLSGVELVLLHVTVQANAWPAWLVCTWEVGPHSTLMSLCPQLFSPLLLCPAPGGVQYPGGWWNARCGVQPPDFPVLMIGCHSASGLFLYGPWSVSAVRRQTSVLPVFGHRGSVGGACGWACGLHAPPTAGVFVQGSLQCWVSGFSHRYPHTAPCSPRTHPRSVVGSRREKPQVFKCVFGMGSRLPSRIAAWADRLLCILLLWWKLSGFCFGRPWFWAYRRR